MKQTLLLFVFGLLAAAPASAQGYCIPPMTEYCFSPYDAYINDVITTGGITNYNNLGSNCSGQDYNYLFYWFYEASDSAGGNLNLTVNLNPNYPVELAVWIDWDQDSTFQLSEQLYYSGTAVTTASIPLNIPVFQPADTVRLRIRAADTIAGPCDSVDVGETEDYPLIVLPAKGGGGGQAIYEAGAASSFSLWPNPSNGFARITNIEQGTTNVEVFDLIGRPVPHVFNIQNSTLSIEGLPAGIYFVRIGDSMAKLVKH